MSMRKVLNHLPVQRLLAGTLWRILIPLTVVWAAQLTFGKADPNTGPLRTFFDALAFFLIPLLLVVSAKLYLFERYSRNHRYWSRLLNEDLHPRLPSIEACVAEIVRRIESRSLTFEPRVISLEGDWGNGKSRVLRELQWHFANAAAEEQDRSEDADPLTVMIMVDIWSFTNHLDLQFALIEELLSHPLVPAEVLPGQRFSFRFWNHQTVMVALLFYRFMLFSGRLGFKAGPVEFTATQTEGLWYFIIRTIIDKLRANNIRVVWCLDEIDRSTPEIAQQAIMLTKRFLNFPGTTIVLPYVEDMLNWKVFNPLLCTQPDLLSTMQGIPLLDNAAPTPRHFQWGDHQALVTHELMGALRAANSEGYREGHSDSGAAHNKPPQDGEKTEPVTKSRPAAYKATQLAFELYVLSMKKPDYRRFANLASEKFIHNSRLKLSYPSPQDIAVLLTKTDRIVNKRIKELLGLPDEPMITHDLVLERVKKGRQLHRESRKTKKSPSLRDFISSCEDALYRMTRDESFCKAVKALAPEERYEVILLVCVLCDVNAPSESSKVI